MVQTSSLMVAGHVGKNMSLTVAFRTDASLQIGTGHVMRCLTLADALAARGATCHFLCRTHQGNMIDYIRSRGYATHPLNTVSGEFAENSLCVSGGGESRTDHSNWLGVPLDRDVEACSQVLAVLRPEWLIVDHYALDYRWERSLAPYCRHLMSIDDLADRPHICDLLLDQTLGRNAADYRRLVPSACTLLCGSQYALLRPEFAALRSYSIQRRSQPALREILINMGGIDIQNVTGQVLQVLRTCFLPPSCRITVVMGPMAPWIDNVRILAKSVPNTTQVLVDVNDMAKLMADSDLAIGAAGASSWERCCLGLPAILIPLANNQVGVAKSLESSGAVMHIDLTQVTSTKFSDLFIAFSDDLSLLQKMSVRAANVLDGSGVLAVMREMGA
jgi:UDP-2,4-diacetamido-2,4,6-trideoxy-beta-L-altropyranose hydrolase